MSNILVIAEHRRGDIRDVSYELLAAGNELADATEGDLHVGVISGDVDTFSEKLNREGVSTVHTVSYGEEFNHGVYLQAIEQLYDNLDPDYILLPNSVNGLDYAPAAAISLGIPLVTDAVDFNYTDQLSVTREMYGSKVETTVSIESDTALVTIRGGEWPPVEASGDATINAVDMTIDESRLGTTVTGFEEVGGGDVDISEANFLISIG
ncbi:MAG: electron transfer flavoprotein subunit alpha/FixB family protein, partial [Halobacteriaceae archaeon]